MRQNVVVLVNSVDSFGVGNWRGIRRRNHPQKLVMIQVHQPMRM